MDFISLYIYKLTIFILVFFPTHFEYIYCGKFHLCDTAHIGWRYHQDGVLLIVNPWFPKYSKCPNGVAVFLDIKVSQLSHYCCINVVAFALFLVQLYPCQRCTSTKSCFIQNSKQVFL